MLQLLRTILLLAKLLECQYEKVSFDPMHWSEIQNIKIEVNSVVECGILCHKNEECRTFHYKKDTNVCTLALTDVLDLVEKQTMCQSPGLISTELEVYIEVEGKI